MAIKITYQQLVDEFSAVTGRTKAFSNKFIKDVFTTVQEGLRKDENVNIKGLGIFKLQEVAERETLNPKTGKTALIEAHKKIVFKAEKSLREKVNEKYEKLKTKTIKKKETKKTPSVPKQEEPAPLEKKKESVVFGEFTPDIRTEKPAPSPPPPPAPKNEKKIMPTFVIEEKKKKSAWRWFLPLLLIILIFIVLYIVPTKFDSFEQLAFWKSFRADSIPEKSVVAETTVVEVNSNIDDFFIKAPMPLKLSEASEPKTPEPKEETKVVKEPPALAAIAPAESKAVRQDESTFIHVIKPGNTLWGLAKQYYSRTALWPNIYRKNVEIIRTPDLLIIGRELLIPELQGDSYELTKTDSARIAQGYYLAYRAYKKYNPEQAEGYLKVAKRFSTTLE